MVSRAAEARAPTPIDPSMPGLKGALVHSDDIRFNAADGFPPSICLRISQQYGRHVARAVQEGAVSRGRSR